MVSSFVFASFESPTQFPPSAFSCFSAKGPLVSPAVTSCQLLCAEFWTGLWNGAQTGLLPALLEMVKGQESSCLGGNRRLPSDFLDMAGFELGFEEWGGFEQEVEPSEHIRELRAQSSGTVGLGRR